MNRRSLIRFSVALVPVMIVASSLAAPADANRDAIFAKANSDYAAGHFRQAIDGYESLVRNHQWSASLFYDLGNAWFRAGEPGHAILNYERALALNPSQPETEANLRLVREQARALNLTRSWPAQHLAFLTVDHWTWVAVAAAWLALFVACGLWFSNRRSASWIFVLSLAFVLCAGAGFAIYELENGGDSRALAIVTAKEVQARLATADNANSVLVLPAGSEIEILSTRGDWIYAALPNQLRGWVQANTVELVRL
ncbi:MAG TPA: tetratricopeptide repeat protein [Chthoniobacterales bacterium]